MIREQFPFTGTPLRLTMKKSTATEVVKTPKRIPKAKFIKDQIKKAKKRTDKDTRRTDKTKRRMRLIEKKKKKKQEKKYFTLKNLTPPKKN